MSLLGLEVKRLARLAGAMLPSPRPGIPGAGSLDLGPQLREAYEAWPGLPRLGLRVSLWLVPLLGMSRCAASRRYLLRQMAQLLKTVVCFAYFRHPQVRAGFALDADPP